MEKEGSERKKNERRKKGRDTDTERTERRQRQREAETERQRQRPILRRVVLLEMTGCWGWGGGGGAGEVITQYLTHILTYLCGCSERPGFEDHANKIRKMQSVLLFCREVF